VIRAVIGILKCDNQVLIAERPSGKPYAGYWEFPGGKIEEDETSFAALVRELHEELSIKVQTASFGFQHHHQYPDKKVSLDIWLVNEFTGTPMPQENQRLAWVDFETIRTWRILEGNIPILEKIGLLFSDSKNYSSSK